MVSVSLKGIKRAEPSFAAASEGDEPAGRRASLCGLLSLPPPLRCGVASPQVCYGISITIQYLCKPCAVNPPVLPCKHSTFSEYKQFLAFPFIPSSFSKLMTRFFFFAETQKEKANIKSFGKGAASCRCGVVGCRPMGSRASRLRFATAWQARRYITVFPLRFISYAYHVP